MKVTLADGIEYYVLESPEGTCTAQGFHCAHWRNTDAFCVAAPCRNPAVIFLTEAMQLKRITSRLAGETS